MGEKNAKITGDTTEAAEWFVDTVASIGEVTSKKMFGGCGVFSGAYEGRRVFCREVRGGRIGEAIPDALLECSGDCDGHPSELVKWATEALAIARAAKG